MQLRPKDSALIVSTQMEDTGCQLQARLHCLYTYSDVFISKCCCLQAYMWTLLVILLAASVLSLVPLAGSRGGWAHFAMSNINSDFMTQLGLAPWNHYISIGYIKVSPQELSCLIAEGVPMHFLRYMMWVLNAVQSSQACAARTSGVDRDLVGSTVNHGAVEMGGHPSISGIGPCNERNCFFGAVHKRDASPLERSGLASEWDDVHPVRPSMGEHRPLQAVLWASSGVQHLPDIADLRTGALY